MRHFSILLVLLLMAACGDDDVSDGGSRDSGGVDANVEDGQSPDVDVPTDGAPADVPASDGAPPFDAGATDAETPEACRLPSPIDEGVDFVQTLYVEAGASGTGTEENPFGDIEDAARAATPGTRVIVRAGTYDRVREISPQGEPGRPIKFEAEGEVIIRVGDGTGWSMTDARYTVVQGFTIEGAPVHGMNISDGGTYDTPSEFVVLRDITIEGAGSGGNSDCIKMSGVDDFWVLDSSVAECNRGELIDMVGCHRGVIQGNRFRNPVANGVQTKGGSSDTIITGNVFVDVPGRMVNAGGSTGLDFFRPIDANFEAARIRIISNLFLRGGEEGGAAVSFDSCDGCVFAHNTIVEPGTWVARILQGMPDPRFIPSRNGLFVNNIIVVDTRRIRTWFNVGPGTAPETFTFARNLWFATDRDDFTGPTYGGTGIPEGVDELVADPQMVDLAGGDYRVMAGSPAEGAGRPLDFPLPPDLAAGCYAAPATLGAYEVE